MAYTHIKAFRQGVAGETSAHGVAANSLAVESGMFLMDSSNFVAKATAGSSIIGVSQTEKTFASDNQTVAKANVNYSPIFDNDTYIIEGTGQTIVFDAALVASNTINLKVNGVAMTQVTYNTSNDNTLDLIAAQILSDFATVVEACVRSGTRTILITPKGANSTVVVTNVVVAAGASQATATVSTLSLAVGDNHKYFDITTGGQYINLNSAHASSGTFLLEDYLVGAYRIVNA